MARDIGIDLGTANTLIYMKGKGIILREPSVVAVDIRNDTVKFVGDEAKEVVGRTPASIVAVRPLKDGVIADFDIAASMLQLFIKKTLGSVTFNRPRVVICIPSGVTAVERRAVREVAFKAGARQVAIVEEPMAAAIGAGLPVASAAPYEGEEPYSVMGRNLVDGFPKEVTLTPAEIREVLSEQIGVIIDAILTTLERTPPELSADILETGITLAGGGAMLHGMDKLVAQQTGMPVFIAEEPLDCVARGTGAILESPETFSRPLFFDNRPSR
mgnify:CR=1 FL=1